MKTKLLVLGVILLLSASVIPLASAQTRAPTPQKTTVIWNDNFDTYTNGTLLDGSPGAGGWKGWDSVPDAHGTVTNVMSHSAPQSNMISDASDNVHEYDVTSGNFTYIAWQYIPQDFQGQTYFILLSDYYDGGDQSCKWAVQLRFDSDLMVVESERDAVTLPLKMGKWCEIRVEGNLTSDNMVVYYDGDLLIAKNWTAGPDNTQGYGMLKLSAVDLFANLASPVYYDDLSITTAGTTPPTPKPSLQIGAITAGKGVINAVIKNVGDGNATDVAWDIELTGGFLLKGKSSTGTTPSILAGAETTVVSSKILGFGKVNIAVTASCAENTTIVTGSAKGFVFLFLILGVK
jgi:hypothetical protein